MLSTGAITNPDFYGNVAMSALARQDHTLGGLVVEIVDEQRFHVRQAQFDAEGGMVDLGKYYRGTSMRKVYPAAIKAGDGHFGWHRTAAVDATWDQVRSLKIPQVFIGDIFDATSISHHHLGDMYTQVMRPAHMATLYHEIRTVGNELARWVKAMPGVTINIDASNHDDHLDLYLRSNRWQEDRINYRIAMDLCSRLYRGENPLASMLLEYWPALRGRVKFLGRDDRTSIAGFAMGHHGDLGANGHRKPSLRSLETAYGSGFFGHRHTPGIYHGIYVVGTLTPQDLPYTRGPSSWMHSNGVVYESGHRTLLHTINDSWRM